MRRICIISLVLAMFAVSGAYAEVPDAVRANRSAVVTIYIYESNKQVVSGSGFIMDASGKVVTNAHVVSELSKGKGRTLLVKMDNGSWLVPGDDLVFDADTDIAIFAVSARNLPILRLAKNYVPKEGEDVYVIGSPMGLETSFSSGIVSGVRGADGFLQITAPISPGSSGSPVFNAAGDVIGVATMIMEGSQNLNFAVPVKYVYSLSEGKKEGKPPSAALVVSADQSAKDSFKGKEQATSVNSSIEIAKLFDICRGLVDAGKYKEAVDIVTQALEKIQDSVIYQMRAAIYVDWITAVKRANSEDPMIVDLRDKAATDLNKAIELVPHDAGNYFLLAQIMHENAGKDLDYPFGEDQTKIEEYYQKRRQYNVDILRHITKAISLDPAKAEYFYLRSLVYGTQNDNNMAINDMSSAISLSPEFALYYSRRGYLYCSTQQKALARSDFIKAMDITGECRSLYCFDASELVDIYSELITRHKNNSNFYYGRADALNDLNLNERALADINTSIKLKKGSSNLQLRGIIYQDLGKYQNAIDDYSVVLSGNLDNSYVNRYNLLRRRSICYYNMGKVGPAFTDMDSSCKSKDDSYVFGEDSCEMAEFLRKKLLRGDKWVMLDGPSLYNRDVNKSFLYDRTSIQRKSNGNYLSWFRIEQSKDSKIDELKRSGQEYKISKYNNYSYTLMLWEIHCPGMSLGYVSHIDYDTDGNVIDSYSPDTVKFEPYVPESYGEVACKTVCKEDNVKDKSVKGKKRKR